ncbi:hypothetical protein GPECTOR_64g121 [Gonium pectorale]|uniref:Uncharacterized protein n=1 Tax=Gonium pectorale TaxID=33097 RepID=A0A150G446_GONPE|nr:hypothetical protein GPECTOR_64g121 [Gonium pectorale]|eukprot:KXZ44627.1 hypothetical protein GPECTOR_64g121 [Gonium pectorale]
MDMFISQDGGPGSMDKFPVDLEGRAHTYIKHEINLAPGQHHHFIKSLVFDVLGYEALILVEAASLTHPQAIEMLHGLLTLSVNTTTVGLVSINDLDNSLFIDEAAFNAGSLRVSIETGHLWAYGMHVSRYNAIKPRLQKYYDVIKGKDYRTLDAPPLRDAVQGLLRAEGMPDNIPLSQDSFLVHSLLKAGYTQRLTTLLRLLRPLGWHGAFQQGEHTLHKLFGRHMYEGEVTRPAFVVEPGSQEEQTLKEVCTQRLHRLYNHFLGREADEGALNSYLSAFVVSRLNGVELVHNLLSSEEHKAYMRARMVEGFPEEQDKAQGQRVQGPQAVIGGLHLASLQVTSPKDSSPQEGASRQSSPQQDSQQQQEQQQQELRPTVISWKGGGVQKRSSVAVVYMCFERADLVRQAFPAVLLSTGVEEVDIIISQDGGPNSMAKFPVDLEGKPHTYIRHGVNLAPGQHHYVIKSLVFDVLGYEVLILVEEDSLIHRQAIQMIRELLVLSMTDATVGIVSINDLDNSMFIDEAAFNAGGLRVHIETGHLWGYGMHVSRYNAIKPRLQKYYDVIKGKDYRTLDAPPLRDAVQGLLRAEGMPDNIPLSQDSFLVHSLHRTGYIHRITTVLRLLRPLGWHGLHFQQSEHAFYKLFGRYVYEGEITRPAFVVEPGSQEEQTLKEVCTQRLHRLYKHFLGREADEGALKSYLSAFIANRLNGVELMHVVLGSDEHSEYVRVSMASGFPDGRKMQEQGVQVALAAPAAQG